mgnify:CR=1 FL=1
MIDLSVRRPVATAALYVGLLALGVWSFRLIPVELLPEVESPRLTVTATWSGASPEAMEAQVTAPLEGAAQRLQGVREIRSVSRSTPRGFGASSRITLEFDPETRMDFARLKLRERFAALRDELPPGLEGPTVEPYVPEEFQEESRPFMTWRMRGTYTFARLGEIADTELRPELLAMEGVSAVRVRGGRGRQVSVVLDGRRMEALGLTLDSVRARLDDLRELRAAGDVLLGGRRMSLAVRTRAESVAEVRELVVARRGEGAVRLRDVAEVSETVRDAGSYHRIDGEPAVTLVLFRQAGSNAIELSERVRARMDTLRGGLPPAVDVEMADDQSDDIRAQLTDLRLRALASAVVIFLVLTLFLRSLGSVLVVFATIGFSVLAAVNFLYLRGFTLNTLTLAGLAWGFGLVVDNAIVVLENIRRRHEAGQPLRSAAVDGARQVALPVVAATATTAIVMVPFLLLQGELRAWYVPLGWAVGFSILASLFVAFTFVPSLAARIAGRERGGAAGDGGEGMRPIEGAGEGDAERGEPGGPGLAPGGPAVGGGDEPPLYVRGYRALLEAALDHPVVVAVLCVACLAGSWWLFDGHVTRGVRWSDFFGQRTYIAVQIEFPRGAGLERTDRLARSFERKLATLPEVKRYETRVSPGWAFIRVTFPEELEDTAVPVAIKEQMVAYSHGYSGAEVRVIGYGPSFYGGGGSPPNYAVQVFGFNYLEVQDIGQSLASRLERMTRIRDVDPNASGRWYERDRAYEYFVRPERAALAGTGVDVQRLLEQVSASVQGEQTSGRIYLGGEELPLSVKMEGYRDFSFRDLRELRVPSGRGREVRVGDVARVQERDVLSRILRENQEYQRTVAWEFRGPRKLGDIVRDAVLESMELPAGYRIETENRFRLTEEEQRQVWMAVGFAVLLVFMVTATIFESLAAPFVVLLTLPLALIGVFLIFFYTDATFTRTAYIGAIMMGGIVVNNAILVVYHVDELRERLPTREAILRGTLERVRPILMTTMTTVLGLLPLILFASSQDENVWNALVLATVGGLLSSTLFVLTALPVAYRYLVARGG